MNPDRFFYTNIFRLKALGFLPQNLSFCLLLPFASSRRMRIRLRGANDRFCSEPTARSGHIFGHNRKQKNGWEVNPDRFFYTNIFRLKASGFLPPNFSFCLLLPFAFSRRMRIRLRGANARFCSEPTARSGHIFGHNRKQKRLGYSTRPFFLYNSIYITPLG